jgi:hypothetical protein
MPQFPFFRFVFLDERLLVIIVVPLIVTGCLSYLPAHDPWVLTRPLSARLFVRDEEAI